ncbi:hypothetical protein KI387_042871 [Taxus chinensis]|uniref:Cytochrome P450 n=3 Tax=Taxus chinensis TaxID=29808 RepID=A0AA38F4D8_TAXCH|nr:hypothetical protein KI387_042871 [Taxus chinensis]
MKNLCTIELLTPKRNETFKSVREEEVATMIHSIWKQSEQGARCVDLTKFLFSLTLNIVSRMSAGRTFSDHEFRGGRKFKEIMGEVMALADAFVIADFIPLLKYIDLQGLCRQMKSLHQIYDEFAEKVIDEHINRRSQKAEEERGVKDLVNIMLNMSEAGSHSAEIKVTRLNIKAMILDMLIGGVESSSTTVEWAMRELLRNPCAMATTQQEIESVVGLDRNCLLKESDIKNYEYLRCVVKETFRLHPPGPLLVPHQSTQGCNVGGYHIPTRTRIFVNIWAMGRDESIWDDPYHFKPEIFIGKNIDFRGQHYELLPFGTGRRGCPGIPMGLSVTELTLAQLIHCFHWTVEGEVNMDEMYGLTVPGKFPIFSRPSWRLASKFPG